MSNVSNYTEYGQLGTMGTEKIENLKAAAEGGDGGGGVFVVNFEEVEQGKLSADKTFEEIDEAMLSGQVVIGACHVAMGTMRLLDAYGFVICGTGTYNVTFNATFYTARAGDDYWVASQS